MVENKDVFYLADWRISYLKSEIVHVKKVKQLGTDGVHFEQDEIALESEPIPLVVFEEVLRRNHDAILICKLIDKLALLDNDLPDRRGEYLKVNSSSVAIRFGYMENGWWDLDLRRKLGPLDFHIYRSAVAIKASSILLLKWLSILKKSVCNWYIWIELRMIYNYRYFT